MAKKQQRPEVGVSEAIAQALAALEPGKRLTFYVIWHRSPNHSDGYLEWVISVFVVVNNQPRKINHILYALGYNRTKEYQIKTPIGLDTTRDVLMGYLKEFYGHSDEIEMREF